MIKKNNIHPSIKRWIDLLLLLGIALLICVLFNNTIYKVSILLIKLLVIWPAWVQNLCIILIIGTIWTVLIHLGGFRFTDVYFPIIYRYPPVWLFIILGAVIFVYGTTHVVQSNYYDLLVRDINQIKYSLYAIPGGILCAQLFYSLFSIDRNNIFYNNTKNTEVNKESLSETGNNDPSLDWINFEGPIQYPNQDRFGISIIAKRVASILLGSKFSTIGITGPYGSGKSSLLNLVKYYLSHLDKLNQTEGENKNNYRFIFGYIDCWGRDLENIAKQILTISIKQLSKKVDCLSLITLPERYENALKASKNTLTSIIASIINRDIDPLSELKRLDDILTASNKRLLLFLEDLDRNSEMGVFDSNTGALLDRLHNLNSISFVISIGTERSYANILTRICDHEESIS